MSLIEPGDIKHQFNSARSWMKESTTADLDISVPVAKPIDPPAETAASAIAPKLKAGLSDKLSQAVKQDKKLPKTTSSPGNSGAVAAGQYDRMIEDMIRNESQAEIIQHVIKVERTEVAALVKQVARAKGRYLATLLESSKGKSVSASSIEDLKQLRDTHEELQQGLNDLRRHIMDGTVMVEGVRN
ncbi:hypothetical protein [Pelagibius sp. Alg239-R121]|uniref:hypothetical protein n=1 Tax=Pelagibius sp. Alg239-R121 TaxID=2993448 RepID=UPI0024A61011|nr:hypothetical protein [Pelagibius sp. Alg239-R121]